MADNESDETETTSNPQPNALASLLPKMDLVGPTVDDDVRRAIWRYGAEAVKEAVKKATRAKRGRKREPDMSELKEIIEADAREWLAGGDPFARNSNYAIAKEFAERKPGHSPISTHKRIERKLSKGPHDRRWFTLVSAEMQGRDDYPYEAYLRALKALSQLPSTANPGLWRTTLERALGTILEYKTREGKLPPPDMSFANIEESVQRLGINPLAAPSLRRGIFGSTEKRGSDVESLLSKYVSAKPEKDPD